LRLPREAEAVVASAVCNGEGYEPENYRHVRREQMQRYRNMLAPGLGHWWGALHQCEVVAALGLFGQRHLGRFHLTHNRGSVAAVTSLIRGDRPRVFPGDQALNLGSEKPALVPRPRLQLVSIPGPYRRPVLAK